MNHKNMDDNTLDLSSLNEFINNILESTENVRKIIQKEYDEATYVLRPWIIKTLLTRQVEVDHCTCQQNGNLDDQAEEIAAGIEKALLQAQELRKSLAQHLREDQKKFSKPTVQKIYAQKSNIELKKTCHNSIENNSKSLPDVLKSDKLKQEKTLCKKLPKLKPKNFIAANKSSIKAISQQNSKTKCESKNSLFSNESVKVRNRFTSATELDNLLKKISFESTKNVSTPCLNNSKNDCPKHGDNKTKFITEKKRVTFNVVDAINKFEVPVDLLKILKLYQSFITQKRDEKNRRKINMFLDNLDFFQKRQSSEEPKKKLEYLVEGFNKLHRNLHDNFIENCQIQPLKKLYNELDTISKTCNIKKYDILRTKRFALNDKNLVASGWLSNGIWNLSTFNNFLVFLFKTNPITYTNNNQLLYFFNSSQILQHRVYQKNLINVILEKIIPQIKNLKPDSKEYLRLYKMMFTIAQVLNPKLPVLVNTN